MINSVITTANTTYPPPPFKMPCVQPFSPLVVPSCRHRQRQKNVKSLQIICIFPYWCERGCCLVSVTTPVNLSFQDVMFPCWVITTFRIYLEFQENLQFRRKIKKIFSVLNFWRCLTV